MNKSKYQSAIVIIIILISSGFAGSFLYGQHRGSASGYKSGYNAGYQQGYKIGSIPSPIEQQAIDACNTKYQEWMDRLNCYPDIGSAMSHAF